MYVWFAMIDGASCHYKESVRVGVRVSMCVLGRGEGGGLLIPCCEVPFCITPAVFNAQEEKSFPGIHADVKNQCSSLIGF